MKSDLGQKRMYSGDWVPDEMLGPGSPYGTFSLQCEGFRLGESRRRTDMEAEKSAQT
jgi:hypothetical protein